MAETVSASPALILFALLFFGIMAAAAVYDLISYTIPNFLSLLLIGGFAVLALMLALPWQLVLSHAGAGLAMLAIGWGMFAIGLLGGGDAKLFAATSLWMGWGGIINYLIIFSICGGLLALCLILFRRIALPAGLAEMTWIATLHDKKQGVPYGIALAAGAMLAPPALLAAAGM
ncbi:unnamed protein product [Phaeothamnion confervicola]